MHVIALVVVAALIWVVLASLRKSCGHRSAVHGSDAWMVEQHQGVVQLGQDAAIPASHPLSRLRRMLVVTLVGASALAGSVAPSVAADDAKVKAATRRVERGGQMIGAGAGKVGEGIEESAKGVGETVVEGAKFSGNKLKESGQAAQPAAKGAWNSVKESASAFGSSVKRFFSRLFS